MSWGQGCSSFCCQIPIFRNNSTPLRPTSLLFRSVTWQPATHLRTVLYAPPLPLPPKLLKAERKTPNKWFHGQLRILAAPPVSSGHPILLWLCLNCYVRKGVKGMGLTLFFAHVNSFWKKYTENFIAVLDITHRLFRLRSLLLNLSWTHHQVNLWTRVGYGKQYNMVIQHFVQWILSLRSCSWWQVCSWLGR